MDGTLMPVVDCTTQIEITRFTNQSSLTSVEDNIKKDQRDFWRSIGKVGIQNERAKCIPCAVLNEDGSIETNKNSVLNRWRDDFQNLFTDHNNLAMPDDQDNILNEQRDISALNEAITREEVIEAIVSAKNRKAASIDDIPAEVLKNDSAPELLFIIISGCFQLGIVPSQWTRGVINPLLKPNSDDDRKPLNYRGITLISVPCKIYCIILNRRLTEWLEDNECLCEEQNGFRKGRSCEEHIHSLYQTLNDRKISRKQTFACFIDMKKAFDTVNRSLLWYKLRKLGIRCKFLNAVQSLYANVECTVRVNNDLTPWFDVSSGVRQGCILSPTLFSIYINDLAERINSLNNGVSIDECMISILLYADDIVLLAPDEQCLQNMLNVVTEWCETWKLSLNGEKTKVVHFRTSLTDISKSSFTCCGHDILFTDSYKYLGVWLDEHLTLQKNASELSKAASRAFGALCGNL